MADNKALEIQCNVRQSAMQMQDELKGIKIFEEEQKRKEQKIRENACISKQEKQAVPVRSNVGEFQKFYDTEESLKKMKTMSVADKAEAAAVIKRNVANEFKERGSKCFKEKDYEEAIKMYSKAIDYYSEDSIYYSNRSQCYIYLNRFHEAITDAERAIELDGTASKPFFRRTTAYEKLGENVKALQSSQEWMIALPDDQHAAKAYDRIHNQIIEANKKREKEKIKWSRLSEQVNFVEKSSHMRSTRPLQKIPVRIKKSQSPIPDEVIDKLFNNNTGEQHCVSEQVVQTDSKLFKANFLEKSFAKPTPAIIKSTAVPKEKTKVNETNEILKASTSSGCGSGGGDGGSNLSEKHSHDALLPTMEEFEEALKAEFSLPASGPQFIQTWKELSVELKFLYLKNISECSALSLGTLVGAQLDSTILSEILQVIHKYFLHFKLPYICLLHGLSKNSELNILSMFLEDDDKAKLNELLNASLTQESGSQSDESNNKIIQQIKNSFQI